MKIFKDMLKFREFSTITEATKMLLHISKMLSGEGQNHSNLEHSCKLSSGPS